MYYRDGPSNFTVISILFILGGIVALIRRLYFEYKKTTTTSFEDFALEIAVDKEKLDSIINGIEERENIKLTKNDITIISKSLSCQNCGGVIDPGRLGVIGEFVVLDCPYCQTVFYSRRAKNNINSGPSSKSDTGDSL